MKLSGKALAALVPLAGALLFGAGMLVGLSFFSSRKSDTKVGKLEMVLELIRSNYVDPIDADSLLEASFPDIIAKLDPHSVYIPSSDIEEVNNDLDGSFSGIGISFTINNDTIVVLEVISGGPSEHAGIKAGDRIVTVDDSVAAGRGWGNSKVMSSLRGPKGTIVKLGVKRGSQSELVEYDIERGDIPTNTVDAAYMLNDSVGYVKVNKFGRNTYSEFLSALGKLHFAGADRFVVDLRGNGGGFMEMAVLMANEFLVPRSNIVSTRSHTGLNDSALFSDDSGSFHDAEVVVLIDEFSASASEIFAGAMQDNDRAVIVGRRSFGKGLVQQQFPMPDSSAVRLTVSRYYTPSGRSIQKPFSMGDASTYEKELIDRFSRGESYSSDSIHLDTTVTYMTMAGRPVFGGGGIMPDIFVPNDTTGITTYLMAVQDAGAFHKFSLDYVDRNRARLSEAKDLSQLEDLLPAERDLLREFAFYAQRQCGIQPNWRNINISRDIIVENLKALIARDVLGTAALYEVINRYDPAVLKAIEVLHTGTAPFLSPSR